MSRIVSLLMDLLGGFNGYHLADLQGVSEGLGDKGFSGLGVEGLRAYGLRIRSRNIV